MQGTINYGIDLGTTNSAIAYYEDGQVTIFKNPVTLKETIPSVVAFKGERIVVGEKALELLSKKPDSVFGVFKRKMGTSDKYFLDSQQRFISPVELSSVVIKELKNFIHTGNTPKSIVITIPAAFDTVQSNATKQSGYDAGFEEVVLLQEPIAASLAYANSGGVDLKDGKWLVYDLGGGTFDVALAHAEDGEMKVVDHEGDNYLGGSDFDNAIIDQFIIPEMQKLGQFADLERQMKTSSGKYNQLYNRLQHIAEETKKALTSTTVAEIEFETEDDTGKEIDIFLELSKEKFESYIRPAVQRTVDMILAIIDRNELANEDLKHILLIGGSTYIPLVRQMLSEEIGLEVNAKMDPTTAVVVGAAYYAGMKTTQVQSDDKESDNLSKSNAKSYIKVAYERVTQDEESTLLINCINDVSGKTYRVTRSDGGYDSGITNLNSQQVLMLPIVTKSHNNFRLVIQDDSGNIIDEQTIGITHGNFSINGQPLPSHICIEVDAVDHETTYLEPIFKKNDILPLKKSIVKQVSKTIHKDADDYLAIKVLEGDIDSLPAANKLIGLIKISGKDLERDLVKGSDIELTFEISESRDISVAAYLTLTDQDFNNTFSPTEAHIDKEQLLSETNHFKENLEKKISKYEQEGSYESAGRVVQLINKIKSLQSKIKSLNLDDVSDEKYQIDLEKRAIGKEIYTVFNSSYLTRIIEDYYEVIDNTLYYVNEDHATTKDKEDFDNLKESGRQILKEGNISKIKMKIKQFEALSSKINSRKEYSFEELEMYFQFCKIYNYDDKAKSQQLIENGEAAAIAKNRGALMHAVVELQNLRKKTEEEKKNTFKSKGTGLK